MSLLGTTKEGKEQLPEGPRQEAMSVGGGGGLVLDNEGHCPRALSPTLPCERQPLRLSWGRSQGSCHPVTCRAVVGSGRYKAR